MTMETIKIGNRTGIYVQESADATSDGDGLTPTGGDKSPVANKTESNVNDCPQQSGQSKAIKVVEEHKSNQSKRKLSKKKLVNLRKDRNPKYRNRPIIEQFFRSPLVAAGATEAESSYSPQGIQRKIIKEKQMYKSLRANAMYAARIRMGMDVSQDYQRYSQEIQNSPPKTKDDEYPIEVLVMDRGNPFGEINKSNQLLILNAVMATVQDECIAGSFVELGQCYFKKRVLVVPCKNEETLRVLQNNIPRYDCLWQGADITISMEPVVQKRFKVSVKLRDYDINSEEFFTILGKQNNFPTKYWSLMARKEGVDGFMAYIGVDFDSYTRLKQSDGYVYFFYDRIKLELDLD